MLQKQIIFPLLRISIFPNTRVPSPQSSILGQTHVNQSSIHYPLSFTYSDFMCRWHRTETLCTISWAFIEHEPECDPFLRQKPPFSETYKEFRSIARHVTILLLRFCTSLLVCGLFVFGISWGFVICAFLNVRLKIMVTFLLSFILIFFLFIIFRGFLSIWIRQVHRIYLCLSELFFFKFSSLTWTY